MSWTANSVSIVFRPGPRLGRWSGCFSGYYRRRDNALLGLSCAAKERSATGGCGDVEKQSCVRRYKGCPACEQYPDAVHWPAAFSSLSFEIQGPCSAFTSRRARIRYTQALALPAHNQKLVLGHVAFILQLLFQISLERRLRFNHRVEGFLHLGRQ